MCNLYTLEASKRDFLKDVTGGELEAQRVLGTVVGDTFPKPYIPLSRSLWEVL